MSDPFIFSEDIVFEHVEQLRPGDLTKCVKDLPNQVLEMLQQHRCCVAGGWIRDKVLEVNAPKDIDIFTTSPIAAREIAEQLLSRAPFNRVGGLDKAIIETDRSFTIRGYKRPQPQVIFKWTYQDMSAVIDGFDFTICQAALWWDDSTGRFVTRCSPGFYEDLAAQQLVYTSPGNNDPLGSICRALKFSRRGFRIGDDSLAELLATFCDGVGEIDSRESSRGEILKRLVGTNHGNS